MEWASVFANAAGNIVSAVVIALCVVLWKFRPKIISAFSKAVATPKVSPQAPVPMFTLPSALIATFMVLVFAGAIYLGTALTSEETYPIPIYVGLPIASLCTLGIVGVFIGGVRRERPSVAALVHGIYFVVAIVVLIFIFAIKSSHPGK